MECYVIFTIDQEISYINLIIVTVCLFDAFRPSLITFFGNVHTKPEAEDYLSLQPNFIIFFPSVGTVS